jgi:hypothetical protein
LFQSPIHKIVRGERHKFVDAPLQKAVSWAEACDVKVRTAFHQHPSQPLLPAPLNTTAPAQFRDQFKSPCLVEIIELKWLLAGHGIRVHVEQIQTDREYARRTLDCADAAPNAVLRDAAARLRDCMCLREP